VPRYLALAAVIALLGCTTSSSRAVDYTQDCSGPA